MIRAARKREARTLSLKKQSKAAAKGGLSVESTHFWAGPLTENHGAASWEGPRALSNPEQLTDAS